MRFLAREADERGFSVEAQGPNWLVANAGKPGPVEFCFAHTVLVNAESMQSDSINGAAKAILDCFLESCRGEVIDKNWPLQFLADETINGLSRRASGVARAFKDGLSKRMSRVAKLAVTHPETSIGTQHGLFVFFRDFSNFWVSHNAELGGQRRMADDPGAPSRSYLKLEEAYGILGREPQEGETVVDLGAAPGGWSYSAAKHGASVLALDNGPLKGAALGHPLITHEHSDAFRFTPKPGKTYDWLLCDVVDDPDKVLALLERWVAQRWCRRFVVNLKFGRTDPLPLLRRATSISSPLAKACVLLRARHLFHDREEFTLVGHLRT